MLSISDELFTVLGEAGYTGTANDRLKKWLSDTTGRTDLSINDMAMLLFKRIGYSGSISDIVNSKVPVPLTLLAQGLFINGEQGALYDLNDRSTLFQDAAGTTPWTAYGQPLGLQLDKSKGLVLGSELRQTGAIGVGGVATAATYDTSTGVGSCTRVDLSNQSFVRITGLSSTSHYKYTIANTGAVALVIRQIDYAGTAIATVSVGTTVTLYFYGSASFVITSNAGTATFRLDTFKLIAGNHRYQTTPASRPTIEARVNRFIGSETLSTQNVTTVAGGYILRFTGTGTVTLSGTAVGAYSAGTHSITCTAGTLTATVAGAVTQADLRLSLDSAYPYQRVTTATDYADIGAPRRIKYDGIDDFLRTAAVNFSATDKMTVWAGVRKLSDAAQGVLIELSTGVSTAGVFSISAPRTAASNIGFLVRGDSAQAHYSANGIAAPASVVASCAFNIAGAGITTEVVPRINGATPTLAVASAGPAGGGNFTLNPLYFGARAGTTLRFSGEVFSPEVIRGAESTAAQIDMVERIINRNMGGVY